MDIIFQKIVRNASLKQNKWHTARHKARYDNNHQQIRLKMKQPHIVRDQKGNESQGTPQKTLCQHPIYLFGIILKHSLPPILSISHLPKNPQAHNPEAVPEIHVFQVPAESYQGCPPDLL